MMYIHDRVPVVRKEDPCREKEAVLLPPCFRHSRLVRSRLQVTKNQRSETTRRRSRDIDQAYMPQS